MKCQHSCLCFVEVVINVPYVRGAGGVVTDIRKCLLSYWAGVNLETRSMLLVYLGCVQIMMWSTASIGPWSIADEQHYDPYPITGSSGIAVIWNRARTLHWGVAAKSKASRIHKNSEINAEHQCLLWRIGAHSLLKCLPLCVQPWKVVLTTPGGKCGSHDQVFPI